MRRLGNSKSPGDGAARDRRCRKSVLFAGRPTDCVFCRRQAEEDLRHGRRGRHGVRRADASAGAAAGHGRRTARSCLSPRLRPARACRRVSSAGGKAEPLTSLAEGEFDTAVAPGAAGWQRRCSIRPRIARGMSAMRTSSCSRCRAAHGRSSTAAAITAGICRAVIWCTSTTAKLFAVPFDLDRLAVNGAADARARRRDVERGYGRRAVCRVDRRHARVPTRAERRRGAPVHWMDRDGKTTPLWVTPCELVQRPFRSRWTPARDGDFCWTNVRHLGVRLGAGHGHSPDVRPSL